MDVTHYVGHTKCPTELVKLITEPLLSCRCCHHTGPPLPPPRTRAAGSPPPTALRGHFPTTTIQGSTTLSFKLSNSPNIFIHQVETGAHFGGACKRRHFTELNKEWAAAAKSHQSCPTLCDPTDGGPPGSPVPGTGTLEWVVISFSNAWNWKVKVKSLSRVWLFATPWTAAYQAPSSMGFPRQEYWSGLPLPSPKEWATPPLYWLGPHVPNRKHTMHLGGSPGHLLWCSTTPMQETLQ